MTNTPHQRYNPLTGAWVLVSPQRTQRPWLGQLEKAPYENLPAYDPSCYLCPGNNRAGGKSNPYYTSTYTFDNDFPALLPQYTDVTNTTINDDCYISAPVYGKCRVVCFSPRHDLTLPELSLSEVEAVVQTWTSETRQLGSLDFVQYVQVFENKGAMMGCSNPHPHSQIWATSIIPNEPALEQTNLIEYCERHNGECLLCHILVSEQKFQDRLVCSNAHFSAFVPFWAIWPFEMLVISHRHLASLPDLTPSETTALADILRQVTTRYDNLFEISFPYSMGFHQAPTDGSSHQENHLHLHFYPPLLRSATVRKFMVGFEMLAMPQRDLTPERAAARLRELPSQHYKTPHL